MIILISETKNTSRKTDNKKINKSEKSKKKSYDKKKNQQDQIAKRDVYKTK